MKKMMLKPNSWIVIAIAAVALAGCGGGETSSQAPPATPPATPPAGGTIDAGTLAELASIPRADAGEEIISLSQVDPVGSYTKASPLTPIGRRPDAFALMRSEARFETSQQGERLFGDVGGWNPKFYNEPPPVQDPHEIPEQPQPPRRVVGILLGEGASALIQMEDGKVYDVRPGSRVGEWTVLSITYDRVVLSRGGNVRPHEVTVVLGPALGGGGGGNGGGTGGGAPTGGGNGNGGGSAATDQ